MAFIKVNSYNDIKNDSTSKKFILFYKKGTENSECAYDALNKVSDAKVFIVDVNQVKDVHQHFGVTTVPTLIVVKNGELENIVKGCHTSDYFDQIIHEKKLTIATGLNNKKQKRVVVYSTPTCTYCNKLKQYFNKHGIKFTDINVAANQQAAIEMARKSGQRGVPQTEVDGQIIVGFDTGKLSRILNIPTE